MADKSNKRAPIGEDRMAGTGTAIGHLLGMGTGMGMGMGMSEGPDPYGSSPHTVYGQSVIDRHEWRYTVFLVEFLMTTDWQTAITVEPPPTDDSDLTKRELKKLKDKQDHEGRSERHNEIMAETNDYVGLFENLCYFDARSHPMTSDLVQTVNLIGWTVVQHYKEHFARTRPSYLDPTIQPIIRVPAHPSFPSGHATQAHLTKDALSEVFDFRGYDFGDALHQVATRIAENREWAGVHYESDTLAGKNLAMSIWGLAKRNPNFVKLIEAAKAESNRPLQSGYKLLDR